MDLQFVIDRLKSETTSLRAIGGAADMDIALASAIVTPAAYVIPLGEQSEWERHTGSHDERDQMTFGVVIAAANLRDPRGEAALAMLAPVRRCIRDALAGWVPDEATGEPVQKRDGRLLRMDGDGRIWWLDSYRWIDFYRSKQ